MFIEDGICPKIRFIDIFLINKDKTVIGEYSDFFRNIFFSIFFMIFKCYKLESSVCGFIFPEEILNRRRGR